MEVNTPMRSTEESVVQPFFQLKGGFPLGFFERKKIARKIFRVIIFSVEFPLVFCSVFFSPKFLGDRKGLRGI